MSSDWPGFTLSLKSSSWSNPPWGVDDGTCFPTGLLHLCVPDKWLSYLTSQRPQPATLNFLEGTIPSMETPEGNSMTEQSSSLCSLGLFSSCFSSSDYSVTRLPWASLWSPSRLSWFCHWGGSCLDRLDCMSARWGWWHWVFVQSKCVMFKYLEFCLTHRKLSAILTVTVTVFWHFHLG